MSNLPPRLNILKELFKRGNYDFIVKQIDKYHEKQKEAFKVLRDNIINEYVYGGAAGGAKSWTGCTWLLFMCLCFPNTKWFIGREELKRLRASTLQTFYKVCKAYGVVKDEDFKYNGQDHFIQFTNGSRIDLLDLKFLPSDEHYERYGSTEYTGGWIEEGGEVHFGAFDTLKTRVGRHLNMNYCNTCAHYHERPKLNKKETKLYCTECDDWRHGLARKLLVTCNPKKNWLYYHFYKPFKNKLLKKFQKFTVCLVQDNPFIPKDYIEGLKNISDKAKKERLLYGNFDYDDDPSALIDYDSICDFFTNSHVKTGGKRYITADIARMGKDKTVVRVWEGFVIMERQSLDKSTIPESADLIKGLANKWTVPMSRTIVDEDGVGGGVKDVLRCKGFVNNSKTAYVNYEKEEYANIKSQCTFRMAARICRKEIYEPCEDQNVITTLTEEMEQVKRKDHDKDGKLRCLPKDMIKDKLGRSSDEWDSIMMREWFELFPIDEEWGDGEDWDTGGW